MLALGILLILAAAALHLRRAENEAVSGRPYVIDGDTLSFAGRHVRLRGIDAPELHQTCDHSDGSYPCGEDARKALSGLVTHGVECDLSGRDIYGRSLGLCRNADGDIAEKLVRSGLALSDGCCSGAQAAARLARRGLWAGTFTEPSLWRKEHPLPR